MSPTPLVPFIPVVLAAYADGYLTPEEISRVRAITERSRSLDDEGRKTLQRWLDPAQPLSAQELVALRRQWQQTLAQLPMGAQSTLREVCAHLSPDAELPGLFDEIDAVLGTSTQRAAKPTPRAEAFDQTPLQALLDAPYGKERDAIRALLREPEFRFVEPTDMHAYREQVLAWTKILAARGHGDMRQPAFIAVFETLAAFDLSLVVKFGVQFGLFGGAIVNLGTETHHALLPQVTSLALPGCFAMTERGHGSNVRALQTTARYEDGGFVLHTPSLSAGKEWIGNAALHAKMAVVFAQLHTQGEDYGVHAFLVPIRGDDGAVLPQIRIEDCGPKMGLNGVDNGRIYFDQVRIPRLNLLDRFGHVAADGSYTSPIADGDKRFFTMLGTLVAGRVSVSGAAVTAAKVGLTIALRYGSARRQFEDGTGQERTLLDYPTHQRKLIPRLAAAYAHSFAQQTLVANYVTAQGEAPGSPARRALEALAAGLKALGTWNTRDTLQLCREACGGQGYLSANRIHALRADTDVFTTFEGDNTVLLQLVAKGVLSLFAKSFAEDRMGSVLRAIGQNVATALTETNPFATRDVNPAHLRDFAFHLKAFEFRERSLTLSLADRIRRRVAEGMSGVDAFNACQDHAISLARAHIERFIVAQFQGAVGRAEGAGKTELQDLCALYALWSIERDFAWFLENGYVEGGKAKAMREQVDLLCGHLRAHVLPLCDAFVVPPTCLGPLADPTFLAQTGLA